MGEAEQHPAGIYEGLLVDWLYRNGRRELAARVLFPALDSLPLDNNLLDAVRAELGHKYGIQMLAAFVNRDYGKTLQLAKTITERYPETIFSQYAGEFQRQLPLRRDDFKGFRLPTPAEWAALKQKLSRAEQIDYLCRRFRLINCFQEGQPGHAADSDRQFAEKSEISEDASFPVRTGKTEVINPLVELAGPIDRYFEPGKKRPTGMDLTLADVKYLAPHLHDDWFMLTISFFRNFAPGRTLHSTRPLVARVINDLAKMDLCEVEALSSMTEKERDQKIQVIIRWAGEVIYEFATNQPGNTRRDPNRNTSKEIAEARSWLQVRIRELEARNSKNP